MIIGRGSVIAATLALSAGHVWAQGQVLSDPMQPPALVAPAKAGASESSTGDGVLQSTLLSKGRRIAMIDGKPMQVGDRVGAAVIVAIDPASVTLNEAGATRVLQLYHGVEISGAADAKVTARRPARKEGAK